MSGPPWGIGDRLGASWGLEHMKPDEALSDYLGAVLASEQEEGI